MQAKDYLTLVGILTALLLGLFNYFHSRRTAYLNTVTSERVKWIGKLRKDIAQLCATGRHFFLCIDQETRNAKLQEIDRLKTEIRLQLNPIAALDHNVEELLQAFPSLAEIPSSEKMSEAIEELVLLTQQLLKAEWEKVKIESGSAS